MVPGEREMERKRASFNMQIKYTTLFSLAKINHNWAGTHNHRGNLMTHFVFGSRNPNLCAPLPCVLLCVYTAFTDFSKRIKSLIIKGSLLTAQHPAAFHFIFLFTTSIRYPQLFFSLLLKRIACRFTFQALWLHLEVSLLFQWHRSN